MCGIFSEGAAMSPRRNPILQQTLAALKAAGAEGIEVWHGGNTSVSAVSIEAARSATTVALSPRNPWRAHGIISRNSRACYGLSKKHRRTNLF
jgi:hypothetical protein